MITFDHILVNTAVYAEEDGLQRVQFIHGISSEGRPITCVWYETRHVGGRVFLVLPQTIKPTRDAQHPGRFSVDDINGDLRYFVAMRHAAL